MTRGGKNSAGPPQGLCDGVENFADVHVGGQGRLSEHLPGAHRGESQRFRAGGWKESVWGPKRYLLFSADIRGILVVETGSPRGHRHH